ncbi:VUT family protein (plasmid) [Candidatus Trichorickettsia mobilis]|uniref:queuosine precursor transporter n=1 Tax=Candidatus Trichorickettsia mobilis TaxID=1346319 RepID=UPI002B261500|nr:queuosine precursor transporter [Candidatus Trichorickettsia mobilis]WPY01904.1 VUT family protein [Candidatus Trichorickettsia mobilis]
MNESKDRVYTTLCALFAVLIVMGNLIYQKFVFLPILPFYTFELSVGAILYPLTFMLTDLIAEFFGKNRANFCVKLALALNITVALIIAFMDKLNATSWSKIDNDTFHKVFGLYGVSFLGSIIACYIAQLIDIRIYLWIRKLTGDKYLWLRSNGSTAISLFVDTTIVISFLTTFGVLPVDKLWLLIFNSYLFKLFFSICSIPLFYASVSGIGAVIRISTDSAKIPKSN